MEDETFLLGELQAPVRSFRLYALEKFIKDGASETLLQALLSHKDIEDDPECAALVDHAIAAVRLRLEGQNINPAMVTPEHFQPEFARLDSSQKIAALSALPLKATRELGPCGPALLQAETHQMVQAIIIRTLGRFWPRDRLKDISPLLRSDHLSTRIAVLETLIQHAPDLLARDFPKLLTSRDPRIRALAVRGLAKIDVEEALAHLEVLFNSRDPSNVLAALQNSIFFPYDRVKPMLLKALALETNGKMTERIGLFLENNPDTEIPYRLWEIAESSTGEKERIVKTILQKCCKNIEQAGILEGEFKSFYQQLQEWILKRARTRWVQELLSRLSDPDVNLVELEGAIREKIASPQMKEILNEALSWPQTEPIKDVFLKIISPHAPPVEHPPTSPEISQNRPAFEEESAATPQIQEIGPRVSAPPAPTVIGKALPKTDADLAKIPFAQLSPEEKIRLTASWQKKDHVMVQAYLGAILYSVETPNDLLATGLRTGLRLDLKNYVDSARKHIKSKDPNLASASLEYLGKFDPDWLMPFLGSYLQSDQLRIKSTALRILQRTDPKQSLSVLTTMLASKNPEQQKTALACMVHFDFSLLRGILSKFLHHCKDGTLVESGLFFFRANPEPDNLYQLYCLERSWEAENNLEWSQKAEEIRVDNEKALIETSQLEKKPSQEREAAFAQRLAEEKARAVKPPAPYSVKALVMEEQMAELSGIWAVLKVRFSGMSTFDILKTIWSWILETGRNHPAIAGMALLITAAFWVLLGWEAGEPPIKETKATSVLATSMTLAGKISKVAKGQMTVQGNDGKTFTIFPPDGRAFGKFSQGQELKITVLPFRVGEDGVIQAQCQSIENK